MKKSLIMGVIFLLICSLGLVSVGAIYVIDGTNLVLTGEEELKTGETGTMYVKIASDKTIGSVTFTIEKSDNVASIKCTSENTWTVTENPNISKYNAYKSTGATNENIMKIEYTLSEEASVGEEVKIEIKEITAATIEGEELDNISNTSQKVTIVGEPTGNEPSGNEPSGNKPSGNEPSVNEPSVNEPSGNKATGNNSTTTANKTIIYAGLQNYTFAIIGGTILIATIAYIKYKQYKNI